MVIIGIDPGLRFAGFSVLKKEMGKTYLLDIGYLKLSPTKTVPERVLIFHDFFAEKITHWQVTDLALETPFLGKNSQTFLKLGYLRGILYLLSEKNKLLLHEFSPREVKQSITGFGGADKAQVARILMQLFPKLSQQLQSTKTDDSTDALAIALSGLWRPKLIDRPKSNHIYLGN